MASTYKFNPGFQSDEESVQNFIVRKDDLARVLAPLREGTAVRPRILIVAPRGAGKTTLCRRVLAEVHRDPALSSRWHPVFFGEESYAITTPGEFFLECLFHLQDRSDDPDLKAAYGRALSHPGEKDLADLVLKTLRAFSKRLGKRLLIIVENFQTILDDQIGSGAKELLKRLSDFEFFGVLATSVSQLVTEENVALPPDFLRIGLDPLSKDECRALWNSLTRQNIRTDRIRPLEILTGGSPRLIHILADFMRSPSLHNLMENLNFLIDQNTEYFKSQLDGLPPTERKIFAALLEAWDPATAKQVSEAARVTTNTASAMLSRLAERGAVVKSPGSGKQALYSASERLFNIYYLMRRRSHPSSRVRALVSFMTDYYDRDELIDTVTTLAREACSVGPDSRMDYHAFYDALLARASTLVRTSILERTPSDFLTSFTAHQKATAEGARAHAALPAAETRGADDELAGLMAEAERAEEAGEVDEAIALYSRARLLRPRSATPRMRLAVLYLTEHRIEEAIETAGEVVKARPKDPWGHAIQGLAHVVGGDADLAEAAFESALRVDPDYGLAISGLGEIKEEKGLREEAVLLFERGLRLDVLTDGARAVYARVLQEEDRRSDAEDLLRAVADEEDHFRSRRGLVDLLAQTDRQEEGIEILRRVAVRSQDWRHWADLGGFVLSREGRDQEAVEALEKAIELGAENPVVFTTYARALQLSGEPVGRLVGVATDLINRLPDDNDAWLSASLLADAAGNRSLAEAYVRNAIKLSDDARGWLTLAILLSTQAERTSEAETAFRKALALSRKDRICSAVQFWADFLVHRGEDAAAGEAIAEWFADEDPCYCCTVLQGDIAARNNEDGVASNAYRRALELRSDGIHALTGLSNFVDRQEGERLIVLAMEESRLKHRSLLARARLRKDDVESQIADASEAVRLSPTYAEGHLFLARALLGHADTGKALEHLKSALEQLPRQRELTAIFAATAMAADAAGLGDRVSEILDQDEFGSKMEPLLVALRIRRGDKPVVAKEIMEVALDIANGDKGHRRTMEKPFA